MRSRISFKINARKSWAEKVKKSPTTGSEILFYTLYSLVFGAAKMEADLKIQNKISEPVVGDFFTFSAQDFRAFILKELRDRINQARIDKK